jgi:antitoxin component YwqK of YwqJK toxin-antitoxin module
MTLSQGILSGESRWNYGDGKIWIKMTVRDGVCEKIPEIYSESGEPAQAPKRSDSQGSGYFKVLDASGKPIAQWGRSGEETSTEGIRVFYAGGEPSLELAAAAENLEGVSKLYYPGKFIFQEMGFQAGGLAEGIKTYYPGGALWTELIPDSQTRQVRFRVFYEDGSLWISGDEKDLQEPCPLRMHSEGEWRKPEGA